MGLSFAFLMDGLFSKLSLWQCCSFYSWSGGLCEPQDFLLPYFQPLGWVVELNVACSYQWVSISVRECYADLRYAVPLALNFCHRLCRLQTSITPAPWSWFPGIGLVELGFLAGLSGFGFLAEISPRQKHIMQEHGCAPKEAWRCLEHIMLGLHGIIVNQLYRREQGALLCCRVGCTVSSQGL